MSIHTHAQRPDLGERVTLYQIDATPFDLGFFYLCAGTLGDQAVSWDGEVYSPHPIMAEGFEVTTSGSMGRPILTIGNLDNSFTAIVELNDDLQGAVLTRIRTYSRYLDDGAEPDPAQHFPPDVYIFSRKTDHTPEQIAWELVAPTDQEGVRLPRRKLVRDYCDHDYRRWDTVAGAFDYSEATCPYAGASYFDDNGDPTTAPLDRCSKKIATGCKRRFGEAAVLPTRAFPGVNRIRAN